MFRDRIRENYDDLTPGFSRLADFIIDNTLEVAFLTGTDLAKRAGVDPATVVRFAQEIGYSGYRELSQEIKKFVYEQVSSRRRMVEEPTSFEGIVQKTCELAQVNLERFSSTELPTFTQAAEILAQADQVWVTGEFVSEDLAAFIARCFGLIGIPARVVESDKGSLSANLAQMEDGHVLLALNSVDPGFQVRDVVRALESQGIRTVAITASNISPPAREAEISVSVPIRIDEGVPRISILLMVMGLMWEVLAHNRGDQAKDSLIKYADNLNRLLK
jgi:DNA-binding MurR/RpiR family transcriptional regulator